MAEHYDEMTMLLYLEQQLETERSREVRAHLANCSECSALLRSLQHENLWLRDALTAADESVPAHILQAPTAGVPWGWIMSLGLGVTGAYALWSGVVEPWQQNFAQAGFTQTNLLSMMFFSSALWKGWGEMRNIVEILASAGVMLIVFMLLRHNWRRWTTIGLVMGSLAFGLAMPSAAMAGEAHHGDPSYTLPTGKTVDTDLFVAADYIRIDGDVNGDFFVVGSRVVINGHIAGDVFGFAESIQINGHVDGNVRTWSQNLTISGTVAKNFLGGADSAVIDPKGSVGGSATIGAGHILLNGPVGRDVMASAGEINFTNKVGGNVLVNGRRISVDSGAVIGGGLTYYSEQPPTVDSGATIKGAMVEGKHRPHVPSYKQPRYYWHQAFKWAASFLFGLALILLVPAFFGDVVRSLDRVGISGGIGFLTLVGIPIAAIIACCTIVGLAVGISSLLVYVIACYSAHIFVGVWVGRKLLGEGTGTGAMLGRLALGLAILTVIRLVPWLGGLVGFLVLLWGFGALGVTVYRRLRPTLAVA